MTTQTTTYRVWTHGLSQDFRSWSAAYRYACEQQWCSDTQIVDVATGEQVDSDPRD